jgi:hypothetical protein
MRITLRLLIVALAAGALARATPEGAAVQEWTFRSLDGVKVVDGTADLTTYRGRHAVHLTPAPDHQSPADDVRAILADSDMTNGTIEAEVAGAPRVGAAADSRGFIGVSFRIQPDDKHFENLYLRPTNGRADDQLRRNHAVQYTSEPEFPWPRLREESAGKYESYADLEAGAWTNVKIVVSGRRAELYVNRAAQPCLIVTDLKLGETHGRVALWAHSSTDGYFSRLAIRRQ